MVEIYKVSGSAFIKDCIKFIPVNDMRAVRFQKFRDESPPLRIIAERKDGTADVQGIGVGDERIRSARVVQIAFEELRAAEDEPSVYESLFPGFFQER